MVTKLRPLSATRKRLTSLLNRGLLVLSVAIALLTYTPVPAHAATNWTVTTTGDGAGACNVGTGSCTTLRAAMGFAASGDSIGFNTGGTILLTSPLPPLVTKTLTINGSSGSGQITIDGATKYLPFCLQTAGFSLTLNNIVIQNGYSFGCASGDGGAIYGNTGTTIILNNSTIQNSKAGFGGGAIFTRGTARITNSLLQNNQVSSFGGALNGYGGSSNLIITNSTIYNNTATVYGGGINTGGFVSVTDSTIIGNSAGTAGGGISTGGTVTIANTTITGNQSNQGGGINNAANSFTAINSTIAGNSRAPSIGGNVAVAGGVFTANNTIIAGALSGGNCAIGGVPITGNGPAYNLTDDNTCGGNFSQVATVQLRLGTVGNYGGPTQTISLLTSSVAIDAGSDSVCAAAPISGVDQRGVSRPQGQHCDIGAFEVIPNAATYPQYPLQSSVSLCALIGGGTTDIVGVSMPSGAVPNGSIFCRILYQNGKTVTGPETLGSAASLAASVIQAVDVYGLQANGSSVVSFNSPVQVCLQGSGTFEFLDASNSPRTLSTPPATSQGGYTCASIPNAGTVILIAGAAAPAGSVGTGSTAVVSKPLTMCTITTNFGLNLHNTPDGSIIGYGIPSGVTLKATARAGDWILVTYGSSSGWLFIPNDLSLSLNCN